MNNGTIPGGPGVYTDEIGSYQRIQYYSASLTLPEAVGADVTADIQITQQAFQGRMILWDQTSPLEQGEYPAVLVGNRDGLFTLEYRTSSRNYSNLPALIRTVAGDPVNGRPVPFPMLLTLEPKETIVIKLTNLIDRTNVPAAARRVDMTFLGCNIFMKALES